MARLLAPSLLAADPGLLAEQMKAAERGGAAMWHLDVMDGHFVPNLSFGPHVCAGLRAHSSLPVDAHLMVARPADFVRPFMDAGASSVILHIESDTPDTITRLLREIRSAGCTPAVTLRPGTPVEAAAPFLPLVDRVLLLSVEPGYGGQPFLPQSYDRIRAMRALINNLNPAIALQLDGGVTLQNAADIINAGVDILVVGSAVFDAPDVTGRCREFMRALANKSLP